MATEAQRLIGISLAKIAQSRCGRGGVSLHKNLLVATVLQKARFIFMEEAYHMVHGHYLQANKFLEPDIDIQDDPNDSVSSNDSIDECELDDIFDAPASSIGKDSDSSEDFSEELCDKENSPPETSSNIGLVYLDLDKHLQKAVSQVATSENSTTGNNKRRREISEWETEEAVLSILPKKIKSDAVVDSNSSSSGSDSDSDSIYGPDDDIFLSDRISSSSTNNNDNNDDDNTAAINLSVNVSRELELDELNNNISNNNNNNLVSNHNTSSNTDNNNTISSNTNLENGPSMEGIDRITSLVSIFSFGNLTRSVSTPDLCSAQATKDSCSSESSLSQQRTYLAMTV